MIASGFLNCYITRYTQNGILRMLDRNRRIKPSPERFQDINDDIFDVVFTVEERIFDVVIEGNRIDNTKTMLIVSSCVELESRGPSHYHPVHVINIDVQDNHDEATFGSFLFYEMCEMV